MTRTLGTISAYGSLIFAFLMLMAIICTVLGQERVYRDSMGREVGRSSTRGNATVYRDSMGRETGRATTNRSGTTFYDAMGRNAGSSQRIGR